MVLTPQAATSSRVYLVDLAGSELLSKTGASGQTLQVPPPIVQARDVTGTVPPCIFAGGEAD